MPWIAAGALVGSALVGSEGSSRQNSANKREAKKNRDFQRFMSDTAVFRRQQDLKRSGINPILAGRYDASTPPGAMAVMQNVGAAGLEGASTAANIGKTMEETETINQQAKTLAAQAKNQTAQAWLTNFQGSLVNADIDYRYRLIEKTIIEINILRKEQAITAVQSNAIIKGLKALLGDDSEVFLDDL